MENILTLLSRRHAEVHPDARILLAPEGDGRWRPVTWGEFDADIHTASLALASMGIGKQACVATFSANRPENLVTDFALYRVRAVSVSIYATSSPEQVAYIVNDSKCEMLFAGNTTQYHAARKVQELCPCLRTIVVIKPITLDPDDKSSMLWSDFMELGRKAGHKIEAQVAELTASAAPEDIATLVYTSGTTGEPKGAILTHANYTAALNAHRERLAMVTPEDVSMAFLPLSHIFEKGFTYFSLLVGTTVAVNRDPKAIQETIQQVHPTIMCSRINKYEPTTRSIKGG
ncbi:MAG: AMP-binding protein, partial [Duncaniella sp.]|nr:AMP-binding protein [Duncaniella sp.]